MKNVIIFNYNLEKYPPIINIINVILKNYSSVLIIGYCSSKDLIDSWEANGAEYIKQIPPFEKDNVLIKFSSFFSFKRRVYKLIKSNKIKKHDNIWIFGETLIWLLHDLARTHNTLAYLFEVPSIKVPFRYKLLSPFLNYRATLNRSSKVVCCEYHRAIVTQSFFGLKSTPYVIPNKNITSNRVTKNIKLSRETKQLLNKIIDKKVILYQGIFNSQERRLDELCQAICHLPSEYVILLMGEGPGKNDLIKKYRSERVIFHNFLGYPEYLAVTETSFIGFLSYFSKGGDIGHALNVNFCAPNKIFEYSAFGLPMLANDVPALRYSFEKFFSGIVVNDFTPRGIADSVLRINDNYIDYSTGSKSFFDSVDIENLIISLIKDK